MAYQDIEKKQLKFEIKTDATFEKLFNALESIQNSDYFSTLSTAQQQSIKYDLRDFRLGGVHLPPTKKKTIC